MEDKPKFAFVGNSHMAFWALNVYFPQWECLNYGAPEKGWRMSSHFMKIHPTAR